MELLSATFPIILFLLLLVIVIGTSFLLDVEEGFESIEKEGEDLKQIERKVKLKPDDEARVKRMFKAYWKVSKENAQHMVERQFGEEDIPAWVKTPKDATYLIPYVMPYMLGNTDSLPKTKDEALAEQFSNPSIVNSEEVNLDQVDMMSDTDIEEGFRKQQLKEMKPKEAEKTAYESIKNLANNRFDDRLYDSISYVVMSFAQTALPKASPEDIKKVGVELKQRLPPAIEGLQMEARSLLRKVDAAKYKNTKKRKSLSLKQLKQQGSSFRLDREGYMKSLPEHKQLLMEGFTGTKENFGLLDSIFRKILSPIVNGIISGLMPLITSFINIAVKAFMSLLPTMVNNVLLPLINVAVKVTVSVLTNKQLMKQIMNILNKLVMVAIDVGYKIISALSIPIIKLFFQYVMPLVVYAARFVIFVARMATRLVKTVWSLIVGFVMRNWSYITFMAKWAYTHVVRILMIIYRFVEPYIAYAMYIATPILLVGAIILIGPELFKFLGTLVSMGITQTPERTFRPTQVLVESASS